MARCVQWRDPRCSASHGSRAPEGLVSLERYIILNAVDRLWQEHLYGMDSLREAVHWRQQGQKDPLQEFKKDAYVLFQDLMDNIKAETLGNLFRSTTNLQGFEDFLRNLQTKQSGGEGDPGRDPSAGKPEPQQEEKKEGPKINLPKKRELPKVGRNDPCPCGSGRKFKACCGRGA